MTRRLLYTAVSTGLLLLATAASAQITCQTTRPVYNYLIDGVTPDIDCIKAPTSLQVTSGIVTSDVGFYNDGSPCGWNFKRRMACGNNLGASLCGYSTGSPDPFLDVPAAGGTEYCDPSGEIDWDCIDMQFGAAPPAPQFQPIVRQHLEELVPTLAELPGLRRLMQQAATWDSLHVKARVAVAVPKNAAGTPATSLAEYEYWEQGNRYHVRTDLDPALGFVDMPEIAYDGRFYQVVVGSHHPLLSLGTQDSRMMPLIVSDPFLRQFAFLRPEDSPSCPSCELRLNDLHYAAAKLPQAHAGAAKPAAPKPTVLVVPGGDLAWGEPERRQSVQHHVQMDDQGRIVKIVSLADDQRPRSTTEFSNWSAGSVGFPRKVVVRHFDGIHAEPFVTIVYAVDEVEVNQPLPDSAFRIPRRAFKKIWNSDAAHWFRYDAMSTEGLCQK
jgi:hypothetical protein